MIFFVIFITWTFFWWPTVAASSLSVVSRFVTFWFHSHVHFHWFHIVFFHATSHFFNSGVICSFAPAWHQFFSDTSTDAFFLPLVFAHVVVIAFTVVISLFSFAFT